MARTLGQYSLEELLASDPLGEVWRAYDTRRGRRVALQLVATEIDGDELGGRLIDALGVVARLSSIHVIPVHDVGRVEGRLVVDRRLIDGPDLARVLSDHPDGVGVDRAVHLVLQIADALQSAHDAGLVHGDVRPGDVLVVHTRGQDLAFLTGFALARLVDEIGPTSAGRDEDRWVWLPPEVRADEPATVASDVYGLGALLYALLTGRPPHRERPAGTGPDDRPRTPPLPSSWHPALLPFDPVVVRALAVDPRDRPSLTDLVAHLDLVRRNRRATRRPRPSPAGVRSTAREVRDAQFVASHPTLVSAARWYPLVVFVHQTDAFVDPTTGRRIDPATEVRERARQAAAEHDVPFREADASRPFALAAGSAIRLCPWIDAGAVDPPELVVDWEGPIDRHDFRIRVDGRLGDQVRGGVHLFLGVVPLGEVEFVTTVIGGGESDGLPAAAAARRFRNVFVSYSHRDTEVVDAVLSYCRITGDEYVRDTTVLRAGERWEPRLLELIRAADVFQLFWSHHSMRSPQVRREWEFALGLGKERFVLPVYWQEPRPADPGRGLPPRELAALHWTRIPGLPGPQEQAEHRTATSAPPPPMAWAATAPPPTSAPPGVPEPAPARPEAVPRRASRRSRRLAVIVCVVAVAVVLVVLLVWLLA